MKQISIPLFVAFILLALGVFLYLQATSPHPPPRIELPAGPHVKHAVPASSSATFQIQVADPEQLRQAEANQIQLAETKRAVADWESVEQLLAPLTGKQDLRVDLSLAEAQAQLGTLATDSLFDLERRVASDRSLEYVFQLACIFEAFGNLPKARGILVQLQKAKAAPSFLVRTFMQLGEVWMLFGNYASADECFQKALEINPSHAEAFIQIFKLRLKTREAGNLAALTAAGDRHLHHHFAYTLRLGQLLFELGFKPEARECFKQVLILKPDYFPARISLHLTQLSADQKTEALQELETIYQAGHPFPPTLSEGRIYADAAHAAREVGRPDLCLRFYSHAILCDRPLLGEDDRGALSALQAFVDEKGSPDEKNFWLAFTTFVGGNPDRTRQIIGPVITTMTDKPLLAEARRLLAECDRTLTEEAEYYRFIARMKAGVASASGQLGKAEAENWARAASGSAQAAEGHYRQTVDLPRFPLGHAGPDAEARAAPIREYAQNHPDDTNGQYDAGVLLAAIGDFSGSISCFDTILRTDPEHPRARLALTRVLEAYGDMGRLKQELAKGVERQPAHPALRAAHAVFLLKFGDAFQGLLESRQALAWGSESPLLRLARGECFLSLGRIAEARREIDLALTAENLPADLQAYLGMIKIQIEASTP